MFEISCAPATPARSQRPLHEGIKAALTRRWCSHRQNSRRQATRRLLQSLSDRTLKDIGLTRSEIVSIASANGDHRWPRRLHRDDER